jgi:hypothetical protein
MGCPIFFSASFRIKNQSKVTAPAQPKGTGARPFVLSPPGIAATPGPETERNTDQIGSNLQNNSSFKHFY